MRNTNQTFSIIFVVALLGGCSGITKSPSVPIPQNFAQSNQRHIQAVEHWSIIAEDLANQTIVSLEKNKLSVSPIYVKHPSLKTEFSVAFHDFLVEELVKKGMKVNRSNANNTVLEYKVQAIEFNSYRDLALVGTKAKWTSVGAGILVVRDVLSKNFSSKATDIMTGAILYDFWNADEGAPKLELLISSAIVDKNVYVMKTTDVYYANRDDSNLYQGERNGSGARKHVFDDAFYHQ
jgi:hypothetical protein